jgi:5-deoxy-glucuronate isomerase
MALLDLTGEGRVEGLLEPGVDGRLGAARSSGAVCGVTGAAVAWVIVEDGDGQLRAGPHAVSITGRASVFEQPGWSAIVGPGARFELDGDLRATVVWRASARDTPTRVIDPAAIAEEVRGEGTTARRVRTYVAEGELIVGETLNPPGGWSSYPPHRHEHEELYLYRFDTDAGFGVHVSYDDTADAARVVRDGSIERITGGYPPVVAAPASAMYYLWALAGDHDTVDTEVDPHFLTPVSGTGESRAQGVASGGTDDRN